ncbi:MULTISPECIES: hypothetical protein [Kitasatospora]|uniref:hypothetical protein n=1 Tax=Kitasatospora TaxID=2063 RepID=UPI000C7120E9|nr:hypothetical protein [Kitasatospora sp. GP30]MDH6139349.1 hypothetical protein [Kitasatospora sp. GP30]
MKFRPAASAGVLALAATAGLFSAGSAAAAVSGGGCTSSYLNGALVQSCVSATGATSIQGAAYTSDSVHNSVYLCVEIVNAQGAAVANSERCAEVDAYHGSVIGPSVSVPSGAYRNVAWFTAGSSYAAVNSPSIAVS